MLLEFGFGTQICPSGIQNLIRIVIIPITETTINGLLMSRNAVKLQIRAPTQQLPQLKIIGLLTTAHFLRRLLVKLSLVKCFILLRNRLMIITVRRADTGSLNGPLTRTITNVTLLVGTQLTMDQPL